MAVIAGLSEDVEEGSQIFAAGTPFAGITVASAYSSNLYCYFKIKKKGKTDVQIAHTVIIVNNGNRF